MAKSQKKIETFYQEEAFNFQFSKEIDGSVLQQVPFHQFQQETIEIQKKEIENLKLENKILLAQQNEHGIEMDKIKQMLSLKVN